MRHVRILLVLAFTIPACSSTSAPMTAPSQLADGSPWSPGS